MTRLMAQSTSSSLRHKKAVLKSFAKFREKNQCWGLFLIKLQAFRPATSCKRYSNTAVFL